MVCISIVVLNKTGMQITMYYSSNHKEPIVNALEAEDFLHESERQQDNKAETKLTACLLKEQREIENAPNECVVLGYN